MRSAIGRYTLYGALFGACFPLVATPLAAHLTFGAVGWGELTAAQRATPLLWIIDTAPFWLGLFARFGGVQHEYLRRAHERLYQSEKLFRATFEQAAVGIAHLGPDGRWLRVNRRFCEIVGYPREELLELTFQDITHPEDLEADLGQTERLLAGEIACYRMEKRYVHRDRHAVWVRLTGSLVRDPERHPAYFIAVVENISGQKEAEEALREREEQLYQAQKMEAVGRLAGGIAHDFNNILTAIKGNAQLLLMDLPPGASMRDDLEEIDQAATRAAALTGQLLAFSRKQVLQTTTLDLNAQIAGTRTMLRGLIGKDVELACRLDPELGRVRADPRQIERVLLNLVVNACDAMPNGGVLGIGTSSVKVTADSREVPDFVAPGAYVRLEVTDSGVGMDAATLERIWEPFFTTKPQDKGTGLGLSTVYGIVQQSEGYVWATSTPGRSTAFMILLPRVDAEPDEALPPPAAALGSGSERIPFPLRLPMPNRELLVMSPVEDSVAYQRSSEIPAEPDPPPRRVDPATTPG